MTRLNQVATIAPIYSTARAWARPPQIVSFPRSMPLRRLKGATPAKAEIFLCVKVLNFGTVASNVVVRTGPTPSALHSNSSFSRQMGLYRMAWSKSVSASCTARSSRVMGPSGWGEPASTPGGDDSSQPSAYPPVDGDA
mgnify:CR=1 FL=1|nr:hypothetical protein [Nitrosomonas nitrosa]